MNAVVYSEYGGPEVLHREVVGKPAPKAEEVLIRIHAVSVNFGDILARNIRNIAPRDFHMPMLFWMIARLSFGLSKPSRPILGNTFSGEIEEVGGSVTRFKTGDFVFGFTGEKMGAMAEYLAMPEDGMLALKPAGMTFEEASAVPYGAGMAWDLLKKVKINRRQKVLVVGASGAIGSAAVQLAVHHFGSEVTGVCGAASHDFVTRIGATKVIDYHKEDFTASGGQYDLILDVLGKSEFAKCKPLLTRTGVYFSVSFKSRKLLQMLWTSVTGGKKVRCAIADPTQQDLLFVKELIERGEFKAIIDKSFPLEQAVEAHRYFERGNKCGSVVITIGNTEQKSELKIR